MERGKFGVNLSIFVFYSLAATFFEKRSGRNQKKIQVLHVLICADCYDSILR